MKLSCHISFKHETFRTGELNPQIRYAALGGERVNPAIPAPPPPPQFFFFFNKFMTILELLCYELDAFDRKYSNG